MSQNRTTCVREWAAPASSRALGVWVLQPCPHTRNNKQTDVCTSQHFTLQQLSYDWTENIDEICETIKLTQHVIITKLIPRLVPFQVTGRHQIYCGLLGANPKPPRSHPTVAAVGDSDCPLDRSP